jgi:ERCC4-type nuclease
LIIVDSREKKWDHIRKYFEANGIEFEIKKLDAGDYFSTDQGDVVVDRKQNLQELCGNLSKGNGNIIRFTNECRRAKEQGIRLVVLIEGTNCQTVKDVSGWKSKYTKHSGKWLTDKMFNLTVSYDVEWQFCKKNETATKILEILKYDSRRNQAKSDNA